MAKKFKMAVCGKRRRGKLAKLISKITKRKSRTLMTNKDDRKEFEAHKVAQALALGADKESFKTQSNFY